MTSRPIGRLFDLVVSSVVNYRRSLCAPADHVRDDEGFRKAMGKRLTKEEERLCEVADLQSLKGLLSDCLSDAQTQREKLQNSPTTIRKVGKKTVIFANNFSSFLEAYSGIIEIMKGADQQYGGVAYGTLSMFLCVRQSKHCHNCS